MSMLLDDVKNVLCEQGEDVSCLHPSTVKFVETCDRSSREHYHVENGIHDRQAKSIIIASAKMFDCMAKELDSMKEEVHGIRNLIKEDT